MTAFSLTELAILTLAGFAAGVLNAVAGGGTFLSLPALIYVGVPPVAANATATLSALPGYLSGAWGFRHDIRDEGVLDLRTIAGIAAVGGLTGSGLLIVTSEAAFLWIVPWLLTLATTLFACGPAIQRRLRGGGELGPVSGGAVVLAVSVYGGYFNGGLGIMLLAAFGLLGFRNLHGMNGLKTALSALLSLVSAVTFISAGLIAWEQAAIMALSTAVGGYVGARSSRHLPVPLLRVGVICVGAVTALVFFAR
ncbi:sulfite exporter TauE/SafE family protein [Sagittula sp. SSi028]|uniref:sulfite exporter TauE/SafE family protein n=1 Tax=Sagittula sp. SSi028 TaxID=3400636 RepID=UPI003AF42763